MWPVTGRSSISAHPDTPAEIRELLALLNRLQSRSSRSTDPLFDLRKPLTSQQINAFESEHGIQLPHEYRNFVLFAGNGGAGPGYGLMPLEAAVPSVAGENSDLLRTPFSHTDAIERSQYERLSDDDPFWDEYYSDRMLAGCLRLVNYGCRLEDIIVVNGPTAGTVWTVDRDYAGIYPLKIGFYEWYRDWLNTELKGSARSL